MRHPVVELCQLAGVPAVGSANEVACDALQTVDVMAAAHRTGVEVRVGVLVSAVHAAVAVVVHAAVAQVVPCLLYTSPSPRDRG